MRKTILFYVTLSILLVLASTVYADWVTKGPTGAYVNALYCSQIDSAVVLAGTEGGLYKTSDAGETWVYKGLRARDVEAVEKRAACGGKIFAGASGDLFESLNEGDTWSYRGESFPDDVTSLVHTYPPDCIRYVGTENGVYVSNGNSGLLGSYIVALAVDSSNNVYAATEEDGVFKTTDDGLTWTPINNGFTILNMNDLKIDGSDNIFVSSTGGGVFFSNNGGANWTPKNNGLPDFSGLYVVYALEKDGFGNLYASVIISLTSLTGAVYKSTDNGNSWFPTDTAINGHIEKNPMCVTFHDGSWELYVGTSRGIFRTDDFGASWVDMTSKISAMEFNNSFVMDASGAVFIASEGNGIYKTTDGGNTWVAAGTGDASDSNDLLIDNQGNMFAAGTDIYSVMKSTDNGDTWIPASTGLPYYSFHGIVVYEEPLTLGMDGNGSMYVGFEDGDVYKTINHGETWSPTSALPFTGDPKEILALFGDTGNTIYVGTEDEGVFKSSDGGTTWVKKNTGIPAGAEIETFFKDGSTGDIYIGVDGTGNNGLYRSSDGGEHWAKVPTPAPGCYVSSMTVDQHGNLYAVFCNTAVYVSPDKGATWTDISDGLNPWDYVEGVNIRGIFADSKDHILLATDGSGMYRLALFTDVPGSHWAYDYIEALYDEGITTGYAFGVMRLYKPTQNVQRSQMAAFIVRAKYGEDFAYNSSPHFTDVLAGHWAFKYIQKMYDEGITTGYPDNTYRPAENVTRGQMAAFIIRGKFGETFPYSTTPYFSDVPASHGAFKYIQKVSEEGIASGYSDGTYRPSQNVNRAQMAAFIARAFLDMP